MSERAVISVSYFPKYRHVAKHMETVVIEACRRVLYDNGTVAIETISAAAYANATGCEIDRICDALDRHPRGTA